MSRNDMEEIKKLYANEKTYMIPKTPKEGQKQAKIVIKPFEMDEVAKFEYPKENASFAEIAKFAKSFFAKALDISEENCNFSVEFMEDILGAITDANGMTIEDMKKTSIDKIQSFLAQKRELIAKQQERQDGNESADRGTEKPNPA